MVLAGKSNTYLLNERKAHRRASAHTFLSKDIPTPSNNAPLLNITELIIFGMSFVDELELAALFITRGFTEIGYVPKSRVIFKKNRGCPFCFFFIL